MKSWVPTAKFSIKFLKFVCPLIKLFAGNPTEQQIDAYFNGTSAMGNAATDAIIAIALSVAIAAITFCVGRSMEFGCKINILIVLSGLFFLASSVAAGNCAAIAVAWFTIGFQSFNFVCLLIGAIFPVADVFAIYCVLQALRSFVEGITYTPHRAETRRQPDFR